MVICLLGKPVMFVLCLLWVSEVCARVSDNECLAVALYRECSGCSARGQKAVEEVIVNRAQHDKKSFCQVVRSSAFPWHKKQRSWKPSEEALTMFFRARMMVPVVGKGVYYFNTTKLPYGRFAVKIDEHYFMYKT